MCEPQVEAGLHGPQDHGASAAPRLVAASLWPRQLCAKQLWSTVFTSTLTAHNSFSLSHWASTSYFAHMRPSTCKTL